MTNIAIHARAVRRVSRLLRNRGCHVQRAPLGAGATLHVIGVDGVTRTVGVRVASLRQTIRAVTIKGKRYTYPRTECCWSLHSHGRRRWQPAVWALVVAGSHRAPILLPSTALRATALTYTLLEETQPGRGHAVARRYVGAWAVVTGEPVRRAVGA